MTASTLLIGCGRLGGAILSGWRLTGAVSMADLAIVSPSIKPVIETAISAGATWNPGSHTNIRTVVLAVKPAKWREAIAPVLATLPAGAVIVSVMAGVSTVSLSAALGSGSVARVMPTTAVSTARGVASYWTEDEGGEAEIRRLFEPIADLVRLDAEALIDAATAVSGSGAAYAYAFVRDLARAGEGAGLSAEQALTLALRTTEGALARLSEDGGADALIAEVASPGGTTQAGLAVLEPRLSELLDETVQAALARARALGA